MKRFWFCCARSNLPEKEEEVWLPQPQATESQLRRNWVSWLNFSLYLNEIKMPEANKAEDLSAKPDSEQKNEKDDDKKDLGA